MAPRAHDPPYGPPEHLDPAKAELVTLGRRPATVHRYLGVLRHMYRLSIRRWGLATRNPVMAVDWSTVVPVALRIPTPTETRRRLGKAGPEIRPLIEVARLTGLREGSLLRLTAEDFRLQPGAVRVLQKGNRELRRTVSPALRVAVRRAEDREGSDLPMAGRGADSPVPTQGLGSGPDRRKAPVAPVRDLRHTVGTTRAEAGTPPRVIPVSGGQLLPCPPFFCSYLARAASRRYSVAA